MKSSIEKFQQQHIGMNVHRPFRIETVQVTAVHPNCFSATSEDRRRPSLPRHGIALGRDSL